MSEIYIGTNMGGIAGGTGNTVYNYNCFNGGSANEMADLLREIRDAVERADIPAEQKDEAMEYLETIEEASAQEKPRKSVVKLAWEGLKKISASGGFWNLVDRLLPIIEKIVL